KGARRPRIEHLRRAAGLAHDGSWLDGDTRIGHYVSMLLDGISLTVALGTRPLRILKSSGRYRRSTSERGRVAGVSQAPVAYSPAAGILRAPRSSVAVRREGVRLHVAPE